MRMRNFLTFPHGQNRISLHFCRIFGGCADLEVCLKGET
jgi:hypothetical protein